ncbi:MAG: GNAT family N-acetyltransferase [Byssovorax sp.]
MSDSHEVQSTPVSVPIRRLSVDDLPSCLRLAEDRSWPREEPKWRLLFEIGEVYGIDDPDGGLAGAVVSTRYGREVAAISMMLVARRHERRGLGSRLMAHALEQSGTAGAWLTATDYGRPMYERLGFRTISQCATYTGQLQPQAGDPPRPSSRPMVSADFPAVLALDAEVFGARRAVLLTRMPSFSGQLRVVDGPEGIVGYGCARRTVDSTALGPLIAADTTTALALLADLAAAVEGPVRLDLMHRRPELTAWTEARGLRCGFTTAVMVHGDPPPGDPARLFAAAMLALG